MSAGVPNVRRLSGGDKGFTLAEVLIALSILAVGLLGIVKLQVQSGVGNLHARNITGAVNLCRSKIEELRRVKMYYIAERGGDTWTGPPLEDDGDANDLGNWTNPDHPNSDDKEFEQTFDEDGKPGDVYTMEWNIADNVPEPNMKTIRIRTNWTEGGRSHIVTMETQVARKNLEHYQ